MVFETVSSSHLLDRLAEAYPGREAVVWGERRLTYDDLAERCDAAVAALARHGIGKGSAVLAALGNDPDFIAIFFAVLKLEAVLVPCDTAVDAAALAARALETSARVALMGDARQIEEAGLLAQRCPVLLVNAEGRYPDLFDEDGDASACSADGTEPKRAALPEDVRLVAYTSGSTGSPKGAMLAERNLFEPTAGLVERLGLADDDVVLMPLPLSHMFGLVSGMLMSLLAGAKLVIMEKFDPERALELVGRERVTVSHAVPTMLFRELAAFAKDGGRYDVSTLRTGIVAGASVPPALVERAQRELGLSVVNAYGSTETVNVTCGFPDDPLEVRARCAGTPSAGVEVRIVDSRGREASSGEVGELCVRGPGLMGGYLGQTDEGSSIDAQGWFHTGDVATVSSDGYVALCGRKKDLIIRCGNNIVPSAIESAAGEFPGIVEACAVGVPDDDLGERVVAFVSVAQGTSLDEGALRAFMRSRLPRFSLPDSIVAMEALPKLANGKVDKMALSALAGES